MTEEEQVKRVREEIKRILSMAEHKEESQAGNIFVDAALDIKQIDQLTIQILSNPHIGIIDDNQSLPKNRSDPTYSKDTKLRNIIYRESQEDMRNANFQRLIKGKE